MNLPVDIRHNAAYIHNLILAGLLFQTRRNPLKTKKNFGPITDPAQPNPTQSIPRVNPTHGQLCDNRLTSAGKSVAVVAWYAAAVVASDRVDTLS